MTLRALLAVALATVTIGTAAAETVAKSYSYFSIGGRTLEEIEKELRRRGPQLNSTGARHPGATRMQFSTSITYASTQRWCQVDKVSVRVKAEIILPRWAQRRRSDGDTAMIWDTLAADIKRHEEFHVQIARNHARELEAAIRGIGRRGDCERVKAEAQRVNTQILAKHDDAQARFDRVEGINFENRMLRLLAYRLERANPGG